MENAKKISEASPLAQPRRRHVARGFQRGATQNDTSVCPSMAEDGEFAATTTAFSDSSQNMRRPVTCERGAGPNDRRSAAGANAPAAVLRRLARE